MKIINLGRGQGKTTRLLYKSEFDNTPILCGSYEQKRCLMNAAEKLQLNIPEPVCVAEISSSRDKMVGKDVLVDEAPIVLQMLLKEVGVFGDIKAITLTSDELNYDIQIIKKN